MGRLLQLYCKHLLVDSFEAVCFNLHSFTVATILPKEYLSDITDCLHKPSRRSGAINLNDRICSFPFAFWIEHNISLQKCYTLCQNLWLCLVSPKMMSNFRSSWSTFCLKCKCSKPHRSPLNICIQSTSAVTLLIANEALLSSVTACSPIAW